MADSPIRLFTYGSLRDPRVQLQLFGRLVPGTPDAIPGFRMTNVTITDAAVIAASGTAVHRIVEETGDPADRVDGVVLQLTPAELATADAYETADYRRVTVRLASGAEAFIYARA
jgi:hypothetical protein